MFFQSWISTHYSVSSQRGQPWQQHAPNSILSDISYFRYFFKRLFSVCFVSAEVLKANELNCKMHCRDSKAQYRGRSSVRLVYHSHRIWIKPPYSPPLSLFLYLSLSPPSPPIHLPAFSSSLDITVGFLNRVIASDTGCNVFTNFTSFSQYLECYVPEAFKKWNAFRIVS